MLKITKLDLELIPDTGMHIFLEKSRRDGIFHYFTRYSKANNKQLKYYDAKE